MEYGSEPYLTPAEVAKLFKVTTETVLNWIRRRELTAINASKAWNAKRPRFRIRPSDIRTFEQIRETIPPPKPSPRVKGKPKDPGYVEFFKDGNSLLKAKGKK